MKKMFTLAMMMVMTVTMNAMTFTVVNRNGHTTATITSNDACNRYSHRVAPAPKPKPAPKHVHKVKPAPKPKHAKHHAATWRDAANHKPMMRR